MPSWQPSASLDALKKRAQLIRTLRTFFVERNVLEVETPILSHTSVTNPYIHSMQTTDNYYLQTSPEYAMKRLLASGSGDIFQISKAFRKEESGKQHNPEFTMLEWYRLDFDHYALMDEISQLLNIIFKKGPCDKITYQALFENHFHFDPHSVDLATLHHIATKHHLGSVLDTSTDTRDDWLNLLLTHQIEPTLGKDRPIIIYDYPSSQSELAKLSSGDVPVAERFEVYYKGVELANGFHELQDSDEQRARFNIENTARQQLGYNTLPTDEYFMSALEYGLPACAGVALGVDRLVMLALGYDHIEEVMSFTFENA